MAATAPRLLKIQIVGAGAIGCLLASRLAQNEAVRVTLVGRPSLLEAVRRQGGLKVSQGDTVKMVSNVEVVSAPVSGVDVNLIAVKSYDTEETARQLHAACGEEAPVISLQNGVGNERLLHKAGFSEVLAASLTAPVSVLGPADIRIDKPARALGLAAWPPSEAAERDIGWLEKLFADSDFDVTLYKSAESLKWSKLLMNMAGNATSAILDRTPGEVFSEPRLVNLEIDAWREALAVMAAASIEPVKLGSYPFHLLAPLIRRLPKLVLRPVVRGKVASGRGVKMPSLHIDVHRRAGRTEVAWLNGAVVERGHGLGIPTPVNRVLTEAVQVIALDGVAWEPAELIAASRRGYAQLPRG